MVSRLPRVFLGCTSCESTCGCAYHTIAKWLRILCREHDGLVIQLTPPTPYPTPSSNIRHPDLPLHPLHLFILCLELGCAEVHVHPEIATLAACRSLSLTLVAKVRACCARPCTCSMPRVTLMPWHLAVVQGHDALRIQCLGHNCRGVHPCCPFWLKHHTLLQQSLPPSPPWQTNHLTLGCFFKAACWQ